jgi:8-oxo-dGTP diphosphatase
MKRVDVAYVLLFDEKKEHILLVKNKGKHESYYTLPGGAVEEGETLQQAAIREVKEETGLDVEVDGILMIREDFFEERGHHAVFFIFTGRIVDGRISISHPDEIEEVAWMETEKAEEFMYLPSELKGFAENHHTVPYILRGSVIRSSQKKRA